MQHSVHCPCYSSYRAHNTNKEREETFWIYLNKSSLVSIPLETSISLKLPIHFYRIHLQTPGDWFLEVSPWIIYDPTYNDVQYILHILPRNILSRVYRQDMHI